MQLNILVPRTGEMFTSVFRIFKLLSDLPVRNLPRTNGKPKKYVPTGLVKVHVSSAIEGRLFQKWFPAAPNLVYVLAWNKTDVYGQKVLGLAQAFGKTVWST